MLRQQKVRTSHWHTSGFNALVLGPAGVWACSVEVVFVCVIGVWQLWQHLDVWAGVSGQVPCRLLHNRAKRGPSAWPTPRRSLWMSRQSCSKTPSLLSGCRAGSYFHNVSCQTASHMTGLSLDAVCQSTCELSVKAAEMTLTEAIVSQRDAACWVGQLKRGILKQRRSIER